MNTIDQLRILLVVTETIRAAGSLPSGPLFAVLGVELSTYQAILGTLKRAGLVKESGHVLTWVGPVAGGAK